MLPGSSCFHTTTTPVLSVFQKLVALELPWVSLVILLAFRLRTLWLQRFFLTPPLLPYLPFSPPPLPPSSPSFHPSFPFFPLIWSSKFSHIMETSAFVITSPIEVFSGPQSVGYFACYRCENLCHPISEKPSCSSPSHSISLWLAIPHEEAISFLFYLWVST